MLEIDPRHTPTEQDQATVAELAWLKENLSILWFTAYAGYRQEGRGAIVIDAYTEPLGDDPQFCYALQSQFEAEDDEVSYRMTQFTAEYDPEKEFVVVIISQPDEEYEYQTYQFGVGEDLIETVNTYDVFGSR